jgi:protein subunit release factor B
MIDPDDVEIRYVRISSNVNAKSNGVMLRHRPTGIEVQSLEKGGRAYNLSLAAERLDAAVATA